ncbi:hypothetical protein K6Y31_07385 [Motilimonas cestriensis]|uniref:Uncharacterized protein n=1 Tax=Motilimonas cestriensis TaxID=2742685 RepID=A0ABS8WB64_9GAMM|nr:hypothetical protein [Motilimonas cestriensis]MCE2594635.1 hypothetical protein [Motilimonas cestriensis]
MIKRTISFVFIALSLLILGAVLLNNINTPNGKTDTVAFTVNPKPRIIGLEGSSQQAFWPLPQVGLSGDEYQNNHVLFKPLAEQPFGITQSIRLVNEDSNRWDFFTKQPTFSLAFDLTAQQLFLNRWQYRPRTDMLFTYLCQSEQSNCYGISSIHKPRGQLHHSYPNQHFAFFDQDSPYQADEPWLFDVANNGYFLVTASQRRIKVFSIKEGAQAVAHGELPEQLQHYRIKALSVSSGAFHIAALYANADGRDSFIQIFEFELYRNAITAKLKIIPKANTEFHSLTLGNNVLAIGEVVLPTTQGQTTQAQSQIRVFKKQQRDFSKPRMVKRTANGYKPIPDPLIYQHLGTIKGGQITEPLAHLAQLPKGSIKHDIAPLALSFIDNIQLPGKENYLLAGPQLTLQQGVLAQRHYVDLTLFNLQTQPISIAERFRSYYVAGPHQQVYFDHQLDLSNDGIEAFWTSYSQAGDLTSQPDKLKFDSIKTAHEDSYFQSDFNHEAIKRVKKNLEQSQSSQRQSINERIQSVQNITPAQAHALKQRLLKLAEQQGQAQQ